MLFDARRDWSCITVGSLDRLPTLASSAESLMIEFNRYARARHWEDPLRVLVARSLRIVSPSPPSCDCPRRSPPTGYVA
jgi:hypothetical protein